MPAAAVPKVKGLFLCDEVVEDLRKEKVYLFGIFNSIKASRFPYRLDRLCAYAQLASATGRVQAHVRVMHVASQRTVLTSRLCQLHFPQQSHSIQACIRMLDCVIHTPGLYSVELVCSDHVVADQMLTVRQKTEEAA